MCSVVKCSEVYCCVYVRKKGVICGISTNMTRLNDISWGGSSDCLLVEFWLSVLNVCVDSWQDEWK